MEVESTEKSLWLRIAVHERMMYSPMRSMGVSNSGGVELRNVREFSLVMLVTAALVAVASVSCDDSAFLEPFCAPGRIGTVQGFVRSGGEPLAARVGLRRFDFPGDMVAQSNTDSTGWYQLEVPVGYYQLEFDAGHDGWIPVDRESLGVTASTRRMDILRGQLQVRIQVPASFEGEEFSCRAYPRSNQGRGDSRRALVQNGTLRVTFPALLPATYSTALNHSGGSNWWLPGSFDDARAASVLVPADHPVLQLASLDDPSSITGIVRGSWQAAAGSEPRIEAFVSEGIRGAEGSTDATGSFRLELLTSDPVRLRVSIGDRDRWWGGTSYATATVFQPVPETPVDAGVQEESGIRLRLTGPDYLSERRARIQLRDTQGNTIEADSYSSNPVTLCNLVPGRYFLFAYGYCDYDGEPWASQWYDGADSLGAATPIDLAAGELRSLTMALQPPGSIQGRVIADNPSSSFSVRAEIRGGGPDCFNINSDRNGRFSIVGLGDGAYYLAAEGYRNTVWYPGTAARESALAVEVRDHATVTGIEWRFVSLPRGVHP
jgi:hypothetical protein